MKLEYFQIDTSIYFSQHDVRSATTFFSFTIHFLNVFFRLLWRFPPFFILFVLIMHKKTMVFWQTFKCALSFFFRLLFFVRAVVFLSLLFFFSFVGLVISCAIFSLSLSVLSFPSISCHVRLYFYCPAADTDTPKYIDCGTMVCHKHAIRTCKKHK